MPKQRTADEQRAYMREYRAKKKVAPQLEALAETFAAGNKIARAADPVAELAKQLAEAQEEIRRLKQELAKRPVPRSGPLQIVDAQKIAADGLPTNKQDREYMERKLGKKKNA